MINGYPKSRPNSEGGSGTGRPRPSGPAPSPPPALAFVGPPPVLPLVAAGGSGGAATAIAAGALGGAARTPWNPYWIAGGLIVGGTLGYLAHVVNTWSYDINMMWMPGGFTKTAQNQCWGTAPKVRARWSQSPTLDTATDAAICQTPTGAGQACAGSALGSGFVAVGTRTIYISYLLPGFVVSGGLCRSRIGEIWTRPVDAAITVAPRILSHPIEVPMYNPWAVETLPILKPGFGAPLPEPYWANPPEPGSQPPGPAWTHPTFPHVITIPLTTSPIIEVPNILHPGQPSPVEVPVTVPDIIISPGTGPGTVPGPGTGPGTQPGTQPGQPGPQPGTGPGTQPGTAPGTGATGHPAVIVSSDVVPAPGSAPGGIGGGSVSPGSRDAPRYDDKHRKLNVKNVVHPGVHVALNFATEALDFVGVLWDSVPKECRKAAGVHTNRPSVTEKMQAIYHCFDQMPLAEVIENFINNQFEDYLYGQLGRATGRVTRNLGITTGLNRALRQAQGQVMDFAELGNPLPEITYDPATGEFGLAWKIFGWEKRAGGP